MPFSMILLHLAGGVMLLLWAVRMVRTGFERAHGSMLRQALRTAGESRIRAAGAGAAIAMMLQSSTAVGMLAAGFAASGVLSIAAGVAILLGADLGSAVVVQALSFDLSWLTPILLVVGGVLFLKFDSRTVKQTGRILMGIAFVLLSLRLIGEATEPLRESKFLPVAIGYLRGDFVTAFVVAALFTWLMHSSVAAILLFMALAAENLLPIEVGLSFILGANLGGGLIAFWLTRGMSISAQRITLGNLLFRGGAGITALLAFQLFGFPAGMFGATEARQIVNIHLAFNLTLVVLGLPLSEMMAQLTTRLIGDGAGEDADLLASRASALDRGVIASPRLALASARRELLSMGETVEVMLRPVMEMYEIGHRETIDRIRKLDRDVSGTLTDVKLYIAEAYRVDMTPEEAQRGIELSEFAINLERASDIVAKTMLGLAKDMRDKKLCFSSQGAAELADLHATVMANMHLAMNVLVSGDLESARSLVIEKEHMRKLERESRTRHLLRLQSGAQKSIETSDIHLESVRALKEVNSLLASVAYPILARSGDLLESRLAQTG